MKRLEGSVTAITVSYNSQRTIRRLVNSLRTQLGDQIAEFIVFDNSSRDNTRGVVHELEKEWSVVRLVESDQNLGYRKAVNRAVRLASNEVLLVINPDAWLEDDSLRRCMEILEANPAVGYLAPVIVEPEEQEPISRGSKVVVPFLVGYPESYSGDPNPKTVDAGPGAAFVVRRSSFMETGGLDEAIFMYNEEEELCTKLKDSGKSVMILQSSRVYHNVGGSVRSFGSRWEFLFPRALYNARFLYLSRSRDSFPRRILWGLLFMAQAIQYAMASGRSAPLRVALSPWRSTLPTSTQGMLMHPAWRLSLWVPVKIRDLRRYFVLGVRSK